MTGARIFCIIAFIFSTCTIGVGAPAKDVKKPSSASFQIPDEVTSFVSETLNQPAGLENKYVSTDDMNKLVPHKKEQLARKNKLQAQNKVRDAKRLMKKRKPNTAAGKKAIKKYNKAVRNLNKVQNNYLKITRSNSKAKLNLVNKFNKNIKILAKTSKGVIVKYGGAVLSITDGGSKLLGRYYEGDYSGGSAVLVDEATKAGVSSVGVYSGGVAGATAGTFIGGPPGAIVGGVIGAIGGAVVSSSAYNYLVGDKLHKVTEEYLASPKELSPREKEILRKQEQERQEKEYKAIGESFWEMEKSGEKMEDHFDITVDLGEQEVGLKSDRFSWDSLLEKQDAEEKAPVQKKKQAVAKKKKPNTSERKTEVRQQKKDLRKKAERTGSASVDPDRVYESTPVIEQDGTIDTVIWPMEHPEIKIDITYYIRGGQVTSTAHFPVPGNSQSSENSSSSCADSSWYFKSNGYLQDNVLHMSTNGSMTISCIYKGVRDDMPYTCHTEMKYKAVSQDVITLNIDGTLRDDTVGQTFPDMKVWGDNCDMKASMWKNQWEKSNVSASVTTHSVGRWQKRK